MQSSSTGPQPPTGLTVAVRGDGTAVASWDAQQSMVCDIVIGTYSVRYQLRSGMGGIFTVYSPSTSVTLRGLACGEEYTVSVAAINSKGEMSSFSALVQFTVDPIVPSPGKALVILHPIYIMIMPFLHQLSSLSIFVAHVE